MKKLIGIFGLFILLDSCTKSDTVNLVPVNDLMPLQVGKVFFYRLDSTLPNVTKDQLVRRSYNIKDSVESQITDNLGRKAFRIYRYLRDTMNTQPWRFANAFSVAYDTNRIELLENNLRFVVLTNPVKEGSQWKGTQYINSSYSSPFAYYAGWNFAYQDCDQPFTVRKGTINNTYSVLWIDETNPNIPFNPSNYQARDYCKEVYAKGVGLIYKDFLHWVYQPSTKYQDDSYGVRLNLMDYK
jgi:hypothetical protein